MVLFVYLGQAAWCSGKSLHLEAENMGLSPAYGILSSEHLFPHRYITPVLMISAICLSAYLLHHNVVSPRRSGPTLAIVLSPAPRTVPGT